MVSKYANLYMWNGDALNRPKPEDFIFFRGEKFQIEFYYDENGEMPAKQYFDNSSQEVQLKLLALVKRMAEHGKIFDETKFREVDKKDKIFEFKPLAERFFNFFTKGRRIILTNAYHKQKQKLDKKELQKAVNLKKDYELRVKGGDYYA